MRRIYLLATIGLIATAAALFSGTAVRALFYAPESEIEVPEKAVARPLVSEPVRLEIPALGVYASVQQVGINAAGNMAVPTNFSDVGWYKYGPAPGDSGSAVIAGHVNNGLGLSGVFEHLADLQIGDDIFVTRADGTKLHFQVASTRSYPYDEAPKEIIFNPAGSIRLNLITCEGKWVKDDKTYDQRLVVFAKLAGE